MITIDVLPDPITKREISSAEVSLTRILQLDAQLDMYKYFELQLVKMGGVLTLEQYLEDVKPYVAIMHEEVRQRLEKARPELIELGLLKEE